MKANKDLAKADGYALSNIVNFVKKKGGATEYTTSTKIARGYRRLYQNMKWLHKRGVRGRACEESAMANAIQWTLAK